jgi:hypothetical protein
MSAAAPPAADHVVARLREVLAEGRAHRLSVHIEVDGDSVVLRGPVESAAVHRLVVDEVARCLADEGHLLGIIDEMHVPTLHPRPPEAIT